MRIDGKTIGRAFFRAERIPERMLARSRFPRAMMFGRRSPKENR
jgi:hypothetical protein